MAGLGRFAVAQGLVSDLHRPSVIDARASTEAARRALAVSEALLGLRDHSPGCGLAVERPSDPRREGEAQQDDRPFHRQTSRAALAAQKSTQRLTCAIVDPWAMMQ